MKKLFIFILFVCLLPFLTEAQTAKAGADQIIYLTSTNTATLDGSASSGTSYEWTEISTDYMSGGTITSPTSKITTVTGLPQGVFYFQLAATTSGVTKKDTVVVRVNRSPAPNTGILVEDLPLAKIAPGINNRGDTSNYIGYVFPNSNTGDFGHVIWSERPRLPDQYVDTLRQKFKTTIEDGYAWNGNSYARSELYIGSNFSPDSNHVYDINWQGYFPQDSSWIDQATVNWASAVVIMQIHGNDAYSPAFSLNLGYKGNLYATRTDATGNTVDTLTIAQYSDFVRKAHTIDVLWKESQYNGFVEVKIDGVSKFYQTGVIGRVPSEDYFKFATIYDYGNRIVDVNNHTRNRQFSLVTNSYNIYTVTDTSLIAAPAPTVTTSGDQNISVTSTTVYATPAWASGHSGTVYWQQISGAASIIDNQNSLNVNITGLTNGAYQYQCTAKQDDGQSVSKTVTVNVSGIPVANAGGDHVIFLRPVKPVNE